MNLDFLKEKWNLLITIAGTIVSLLLGFVDVPTYAATALSSGANYEVLGKIVVAIVIAIFLIPCYSYNKRKHAKIWGIATALFLAIGLFVYFKGVTTKKNSTVDYTSYAGIYVVKGDKLMPGMDSLWKEMEKQKGSALTETEFFAENHDPNDSTGILTASLIWPKKEIEANAKNIIYFFLATVILFALAIISAVQVVYCVTSKP